MLRSQTVFDEIVVPEQLWTGNVQANTRMRDIYRLIRDRHAGRKPAGRIFLSRAPSERLANMLAVEEVFAGYGFQVLDPERVPIAEQLALYGNCEILASVSGGAMHNCLFARPGLLTIEVGDTSARATSPITQRIANELAQVDARFIPFGEGTAPNIDPKAVRKNLRNILGELPRRGPALLLRLRRRLHRLRPGMKSQ
jgi:capsular polysaccharide biosynthesis protein